MINERLNSFILAREERVVPPEREQWGGGDECCGVATLATMQNMEWNEGRERDEAMREVHKP